ncbi:MAG: hypothetical protein A3A80_02955 [Candidatus Terrybacteria bacterium RIFCSPLOWO2_01_FULL_44_24]|uniref:PIN domain-containing protein n=1 Tax=Candidatus Terrybacteria bacterium RIFCSPHIGHO2_01_FULL_43_35 TaxID=1802361 RepID=A0A1G2PH29_9BACT|nr:MAG: hypothetical protein A2828_03140 [Candidatus Terrybacteria bacterium RIFCSPHIGHO2_01_FULL_43_35]OHA51023.1 MAG: hypothetical protein A3A80_02955 [Candidatus Terrybacteria bacterium RIFCSPLOWO2_01_FULL_44_24]
MIKVVLDQNIFTTIVEDQEFYRFYTQSKDYGLIKPLFTHVHIDQTNAIKDDEKRDMMLYIINSSTTTATYGVVDGISRLGWSSTAPDGTLENVLGNQTLGEGNIHDALLASTAFEQADCFITDDKRLKNRCLKLNKQVMTGLEFRTCLNKRLTEWFKNKNQHMENNSDPK